jgi:hypothetical protein
MRLDCTGQTTPTGRRVTGATPTIVSPTRDPSTDDSGSFSYVVRQDNLDWTVPGMPPSYAVTSLSPGLSYAFTVRAVHRALATSGPSNTVTTVLRPC